MTDNSTPDSWDYAVQQLSDYADQLPKNQPQPTKVIPTLDTIGSYLVHDSPFAKVAQGVYQGAKDLVTAPHDAYYNGMSQDQMIEKSANAASVLTEGGLGAATAGMKPGLGIFAGRVNPIMKYEALKMEDQGFNPSAIKMHTGLERTPYNTLSKEIPDDKAVFKPENFKGPEDFQQATLGEVLDHPELYKDYPELKNLPVVVKKIAGGANGMYDSGKYIELDPKSGVNMDTLIHEVQHAVQDADKNLERNSNTHFLYLPKEEQDKYVGYFAKKYPNALGDVIENLLLGRFDAAVEKATTIKNWAEHTAYRASPLESEAYNTTERLNLSSSDRLHLLARDTELIPRDELIKKPKIIYADHGFNPKKISPPISNSVYLEPKYKNVERANLKGEHIGDVPMNAPDYTMYPIKSGESGVYEIKDSITDKSLGSVNISYQPDTDTIQVNNIGSGLNNKGFSKKDFEVVKNELAGIFPNAKRISGILKSGKLVSYDLNNP